MNENAPISKKKGERVESFRTGCGEFLDLQIERAKLLFSPVQRVRFVQSLAALRRVETSHGAAREQFGKMQASLQKAADEGCTHQGLLDMSKKMDNVLATMNTLQEEAEVAQNSMLAVVIEALRWKP